MTYVGVQCIGSQSILTRRMMVVETQVTREAGNLGSKHIV